MSVKDEILERAFDNPADVKKDLRREGIIGSNRRGKVGRPEKYGEKLDRHIPVTTTTYLWDKIDSHVKTFVPKTSKSAWIRSIIMNELIAQGKLEKDYQE